MQRLSYRSLFGLPLLWASAYFVPLMTDYRAYLLPSNNLIDFIVVPTVVVVVAGALILKSISSLSQWMGPRVTTCGAVVGLWIFAIIALKVLLLVAGYRWEQLIPTVGHIPHKTLLYFCKYGFVFGVLTVLWMNRRLISRWDRLISGLGLALGVLAAIRMLSMWHYQQATPELSNSVAGIKSAFATSVTPGNHSRRVVWVIFDESDYDRMFGAEGAAVRDLGGLPNFAYLERRGVFATSANTPAGATIYSIPALLTGTPIGGAGVRFDRSASLSLEKRDGSFLPFDEATTIFGELAASGRGASVLGFYHPYCKLFRLQRCDSFPWPQVGGLADAFWVNVPDSFSTKITSRYFEDITENMLRLLPEYLARDDALTFVHLNLPHLPASYADKVLHLPASANLLTEYSRNLIVTDQVLGRIIQLLRSQASQQDVLLVVSTDHWLRKWSYGDDGEEISRKVPFIVWKVGETGGIEVKHPVSTVHTASMIVDYLDGKVSTQPEIADWWEKKPVYPSLVVALE